MISNMDTRGTKYDPLVMYIYIYYYQDIPLLRHKPGGRGSSGRGGPAAPCGRGHRGKRGHVAWSRRPRMGMGKNHGKTGWVQPKMDETWWIQHGFVDIYSQFLLKVYGNETTQARYHQTQRKHGWKLWIQYLTHSVFDF